MKFILAAIAIVLIGGKAIGWVDVSWPIALLPAALCVILYAWVSLFFNE